MNDEKIQGTIDQYQIIKTIGQGASCKVKLGLDTISGKKVAIKIFTDDFKDQNEAKGIIRDEIEIMSKLQYPHIVNVLKFGNTDFVKTCGKVKTVMFIALELANGGELFDFIASSGKFDESLSRYYFKQMLESLNYCHKQGVCHRDLKPENFLLDEEFKLKLADFGFAAPIMGKDGSGVLKTKLGTLNYMAPEIHEEKPYEGTKVDIFAAAIILFIMYVGIPPFGTATPKDPYYKALKVKPEKFWAAHSRGQPAGYFSEDMKSLLTSML